MWSAVTRRDQANSPGNDRFQDENDVFSSYTRLVDHHRIISYRFEISCHLTVKFPSFRNAKTIILIGGSSHLARYGFNEKKQTGSWRSTQDATVVDQPYRKIRDMLPNEQ